MRVLITTPQSAYITKRFQDEAPGLGVEAVCKSAEELRRQGWNVNIDEFDVLYVRQVYPYYDEVISLARQFALGGKRVVNSDIPAQGIEDNKFVLLNKLKDAGISIPSTILPQLRASAPERSNLSAKKIASSSDALLLAIAELQYPYVLKWIYGFGGRYVHLVNNAREVKDVIKKYPAGELMLQEYIQADYEYKVVTIGYKSLPVVVRHKTHPQKKVADLERFEVLDASSAPKVVAMAEQGSQLLGRELAKSDILEREGKLYLLEVNRQPGLEAFENETKLNLSRMFLEYLVGNL